MKTLQDAPYLDFFTEEFEANAQQIIGDLRKQSWLVRTPIGALVIHRDKVHQLLGDSRLRSALLDIVRMQGVTSGELYTVVSNFLLSKDGADHTRLRKLVSGAFTARSVEVLRPFMAELANQLVDSFEAKGQCEFMTAFADHYPVQIICEHLGVPREDHEKFGEWASGLTWVLSFELAQHMDEVREGMKGMFEYVHALIESRAVAPRDDLVSRLIQAEQDGDRLSPIELRSMIGGLLFAGYDTTRNQLGLALATFCDHADQWATLGERPELAEKAVEECMRFAPAIAVAPRFAQEEFELDGYVIPAGTLVSLSTISANHDPAGYDAPERFDISAERAPQYTFGGGAHYCLGAHLARAEMQEALRVLARRMPDLRLAGALEWRPRTGIFGPKKLNLAFTPASA